MKKGFIVFSIAAIMIITVLISFILGRYYTYHEINNNVDSMFIEEETAQNNNNANSTVNSNNTNTASTDNSTNTLMNADGTEAIPAPPTEYSKDTSNFSIDIVKMVRFTDSQNRHCVKVYYNLLNNGNDPLTSDEVCLVTAYQNNNIMVDNTEEEMQANGVSFDSSANGVAVEYWRSFVLNDDTNDVKLTIKYNDGINKATENKIFAF